MNWPVECHSRACSPFFGKNQTEYHSLVHILASPKNYVYSLTHPHNIMRVALAPQTVYEASVINCRTICFPQQLPNSHC